MTSFRQIFFKSYSMIRRSEIYTILFINCMIRLKIGLEIRHRGVMSLYAIEDKTAVVAVALYLSFSRNPVRFKTLGIPQVSSLCINRGTGLRILLELCRVILSSELVRAGLIVLGREMATLDVLPVDPRHLKVCKSSSRLFMASIS